MSVMCFSFKAMVKCWRKQSGQIVHSQEVRACIWWRGRAGKGREGREGRGGGKKLQLPAGGRGSSQVSAMKLGSN